MVSLLTDPQQYSNPSAETPGACGVMYGAVAMRFQVRFRAAQACQSPRPIHLGKGALLRMKRRVAHVPFPRLHRLENMGHGNGERVGRSCGIHLHRTRTSGRETYNASLSGCPDREVLVRLRAGNRATGLVVLRSERVFFSTSGAVN